jgi:hypothetical protein
MLDIIIPLLIGSLISLISTVTGITLKHWLDNRRMKIALKEYPIRVLYDKQTEFLDKLSPLLSEINGYLSKIDVWLNEKSPEAKQKVKESAEANKPLGDMHQLIEQYFMYLPEKVIKEGEELFTHSLELTISQSSEKVWECFDILFKFQNIIRDFVGVENLSKDLLKSFGKQKRQQDKREQII